MVKTCNKNFKNVYSYVVHRLSHHSINVVKIFLPCPPPFNIIVLVHTFALHMYVMHNEMA